MSRKKRVVATKTSWPNMIKENTSNTWQINKWQFNIFLGDDSARDGLHISRNLQAPHILLRDDTHSVDMKHDHDDVKSNMVCMISRQLKLPPGKTEY